MIAEAAATATERISCRTTSEHNNQYQFRVLQGVVPLPELSPVDKAKVAPRLALSSLVSAEEHGLVLDTDTDLIGVAARLTGAREFKRYF
jgi:hypothetical protein